MCHQANPAGICGFQLLVLAIFWRERHYSKSPVAKSRVVGEPIAESRVVGEPIVAWKIVLLHFSPQNVRVHFGITSSGRTYPESRVVGEPIVAWGNGFQFPSLYRRKWFSVSRIDTCKLTHTNLHVINKSYEFVVTTWYFLGGMIKIITNMPPCNSAIMRPLLDCMDKIKAFCRDVVAIVCEASEMTRGPTRVSPHEFSRILRSINEN